MKKIITWRQGMTQSMQVLALWAVVQTVGGACLPMLPPSDTTLINRQGNNQLSQQVSTVALSAAEATMARNKTQTMQVIAYDNQGNDLGIVAGEKQTFAFYSWTVSDPNLAQIDPFGKLSSKDKEGEVLVRVCTPAPVCAEVLVRIGAAATSQKPSLAFGSSRTEALHSASPTFASWLGQSVPSKAELGLWQVLYSIEKQGESTWWHGCADQQETILVWYDRKGQRQEHWQFGPCLQQGASKL